MRAGRRVDAGLRNKYKEESCTRGTCSEAVTCYSVYLLPRASRVCSSPLEKAARNRLFKKKRKKEKEPKKYREMEERNDMNGQMKKRVKLDG